MVHLPEVDRDRCEFPNVHAVVMEINYAGLQKLGTQDGELKGYYSRNQFEPAATPLMNQNLVPRIIEIPLGTAANEQSQVKGQGFVKFGCVKSCQANNCKCKNFNKYVIPDIITEALYV